MSVHYYYREVGGSIIEITDHCRLYQLDVITLAEEGAVGSSILTIDDPDADLDITGHRLVYMTEDAIADATDQVIYVGYTGKRTVERMDSDRVADARRWLVSLDDLNTVLDRRIMVSSANRPEETDVQRVVWLEATAQGSLIDDTTYLSLANPVDMDAVDYRGQKFKDVLDDCAQQSGKNYYLKNEPETEDVLYGLWYDFAAGSNFSSTLRISNILADLDATTFAALDDTKLERDPSRVYSGAYVTYDGGAVFVENDTIKDSFALEGRDVTVVGDNVKTARKARARGNRYLNDFRTEEDVITTGLDGFPAALVNHIKPGHRIQAKFSHLPGYEDFVWMRVGSKRIREVSEDPARAYRIDLTLVSPSPNSGFSACAVTDAGNYYPLGGTGVVPNPSGGNVLYLRPGISYPFEPTPGHIGSWHFPDYGVGGSGTVDGAGTCSQNTLRCIVEGEGTMTIHTSVIDEPVSLIAHLCHKLGVGTIVDQSIPFDAGEDVEFTISTHGGVSCTHWVDVTDQGPCGTGWGFDGMEWAT